MSDLTGLFISLSLSVCLSVCLFLFDCYRVYLYNLIKLLKPLAAKKILSCFGDYEQYLLKLLQLKILVCNDLLMPNCPKFNGQHTVWAVDFKRPECKFYLLIFLRNLLKEKKKKRKSAPVFWCFKVCSSYSTSHLDFVAL